MSKNNFETLVLAASEERHVHNCSGYSFLLLTNDQSTDVQIGIDDDDLAAWPAWRKYREPRPEDRFHKICFTNPTASVMTLTFVVSDGEIDIATEYGSLTLIYNQLVTIDGVMDNLLSALDVADTPAAIPEQAIQQTGVGSDQLVAASANIRKLEIQADYQNTGEVYLGFATGVTAANAAVHLQPGQSWPIEGNVNIYASSENGTEKARGYVIATA